MTIEVTGERLVVEAYKSSLEEFVIYLMHSATYRFADKFVQGKRVLDYGCGTGYGSAAIAEHAHHVVAVDVAPEAIEHAQQHYRRENLQFSVVGKDAHLPFEDQSFDVVLSFQVLEHVTDDDGYLREIHRILSPEGIVLLVTPDRATRLLPLQKPWNRWHLREYSLQSLSNLMRRHFCSVEIQTMSGRKEVIDVELRRCSKTKWMTLPVTLPIVPEAVRVACLNTLHRLKPRRLGAPITLPQFTEDDIAIGPDLSPSLNLVALARK